MILTLPKPIRLSKAYNNVSGVGRVKSAEYREWQRHAMQEIMAQRSGQKVPKPPVQMTLTVPSTGGRGDVCNTEKVVTDTLVKMGIIPDDNDAILPRVIIQTGAPPDRCVVLIESMVASIPHYGAVA